MAEAPVEHRETVRLALKAAFGLTQVDAITPISPGLSGVPLRVDIGGRRYLVRVEGPASPLRNPHQYGSMLIAAEAGIAPRVYFVDQTARVAVMDFIDEQPLSSYPGGPRALSQALGDMLGLLQATPPFSNFVEYPELVARLWAHVCRTGLFAPGALDKHTEHLLRITNDYVREGATCISSHNDLVPRNVLFDGKRLWIIDWEFAYRNDSLVDIAVAIDSFALSRELVGVLLHAWLGCSPDDALYGRLALVRAFTRLYYAGVFLSASAAANGPMADCNLSALTPPDFRRAVLAEQLKPGEPESMHVLGKMYLNSFINPISPLGLNAPFNGL